MAPSKNQSKIKTIIELTKLVCLLKKEGKTVAHCHGVFDLLHPGHIRHFEAAKQEGDVLIVTVTQDKYVTKGPGRPVFNEHLRAYAIVNCFLFLINLLTRGPWWFYWVVVGWGIGLAFDAADTYYPNEEKVEKGARKSLRKQRKREEAL